MKSFLVKCLVVGMANLCLGSTCLAQPRAAAGEIDEEAAFELQRQQFGFTSRRAACESGGALGSSLCMEERWKDAEALLEEAYGAAIGRLMDIGEQERLDVLKRAQRAWLLYRTSHCDAEALGQTPVRSGWYSFWFSDCLATLARERTDYLRSAFSEG